MLPLAVLALVLQAVDPSVEAALKPPVPIDQARRDWLHCVYGQVDRYEQQNETAEITVRAIMKSCEREHGFYYIAIHDDFLRSGMSKTKANDFIASSLRKTEDDILAMIMERRSRR